MSHCIGEQLTVVFRHSHGVDALYLSVRTRRERKEEAQVSVPLITLLRPRKALSLSSCLTNQLTQPYRTKNCGYGVGHGGGRGLPPSSLARPPVVGRAGRGLGLGDARRGEDAVRRHVTN